jgi:hypothetical protein
VPGNRPISITISPWEIEVFCNLRDSFDYGFFEKLLMAAGETSLIPPINCARVTSVSKIAAGFLENRTDPLLKVYLNCEAGIVK